MKNVGRATHPKITKGYRHDHACTYRRRRRLAYHHNRPAAGRAMISAIFLLSGMSKVTAPAITIGYIQSVGLPVPSLAFALSALVELVGGLALLLGFRTRITAGVLFLFTLATAAFFHNQFADQNQFIHFFKNVAIAGGLLNVLAFGGGCRR
jgi:putative oxidoreductase